VPKRVDIGMQTMKNSGMVVSILLLLLTIASWLLLYHQAYWEPHHVYRTRNALLYIGLPFIFITIQLELAGTIVYAVATRRLSPWWLITLLWLVFLFWVSAGMPLKWTHDQEHFHKSLPYYIESHG
jgi:hypothetical protein